MHYNSIKKEAICTESILDISQVFIAFLMQALQVITQAVPVLTLAVSNFSKTKSGFNPLFCFAL
jgi:hypothetical protein